MSPIRRLALGLAATIAVAAGTSPALAGGPRVVVVNPSYSIAGPGAIYAPAVPTVYETRAFYPRAYAPTAYALPSTYAGPTAYVTPGPVVMTQAPATVVTTSRTYVPTRAVVVDRAVAPVAYEVITPRKVKIVYPRRYSRGY